MLALREAAREAANDHDVHCVVLRGEGAAFSAGIDIFELGGLAGTENLRPFRRDCIEMVNLLEEMTKPVVAQIHGACLGLGAELALACDLRVMADDVKFGLPETKLGLIPDVGGSSRLPAVVGPRHREGAADDRPHDRRGRVPPDRGGEPDRAGGGARGGRPRSWSTSCSPHRRWRSGSRSGSRTGSRSRRWPHRSSRRSPFQQILVATDDFREAGAAYMEKRARELHRRAPGRYEAGAGGRDGVGPAPAARPRPAGTPTPGTCSRPVVGGQLHAEQDRRAERGHAARVGGQRAIAPHRARPRARWPVTTAAWKTTWAAGSVEQRPQRHRRAALGLERQRARPCRAKPRRARRAPARPTTTARRDRRRGPRPRARAPRPR